MRRVQDLPQAFRQTAAYLREHAASEQAACAWERAAEKVEEALKDSSLELLSLEEAEVESGYTRSHLRRLLRERVIPNSGTESDPRIQRNNLPRKPGFDIGRSRPWDLCSRTQAARAIAKGE
jgi:hypothetical protein